MRRSSTTTTGAGKSLPIVHDYDLNPTDISLSTSVIVPVNYTVQHTFDDVQANGYSPSTGTWYDSKDSVFQNATQNAYSSINFPITASRINQVGGTGSVTLVAIQGVKG